MNAVNEVTPLLKGYAEQWKEGVTRSAGGMPPEHHHEEELHGIKKALSGKWTPREICITALSILTVGASIGAYYVIEFNIMAFTFVGIAIPTYSAYQEQKITEAKALEETVHIYGELNKAYTKKNEEVVKVIDSMAKSVSKINEYKNTLKDIKEMESSSIEVLEESIIERQEILEKMEGNLSTAIIDNVIDVLLKSDADGDMILNDEEADRLILTLEHLHGVHFKAGVLKKKIDEHGKDLSGLMNLLNEVFDKDPHLDASLNVPPAS